MEAATLAATSRRPCYTVPCGEVTSGWALTPPTAFSRVTASKSAPPVAEPLPSPSRGDASTDTRIESLLNEYGTLLHRAIVRCCPARLGLDLDDLEQEARIRVWQALKREEGINHPASYLYRVAASATIDAIRRAAVRREAPIELAELRPAEPAAWVSQDWPPSPERAAGRAWATERIRAGLSRLAVNRRRAVGLHLQGFTSQEIAAIAGWSEPKARNLTSRGMRDLREQLQAMGIDLEAH